MQTHTGQYFTLDGVGLFIWNLLKSPQTPDALCNAIVASYEVTPKQAQADVDAFLRDLQEAQLIVAKDSD